MVHWSCFDRWWKTALICGYASVEHSTLFSQIYTQVIITTKFPPPHPPSFLLTSVALCNMFYCPNLWCRAVVWFYSGCCVSFQRRLYFGGGQSDLYTYLLKFIKMCESHLRKGALSDRGNSSFLSHQSKHQSAVTLWQPIRRAKSFHLAIQRYFGGSGYCTWECAWVCSDLHLSCLPSECFSRMGQHAGKGEIQGITALEIPVLAWCKLLLCGAEIQC